MPICYQVNMQILILFKQLKLLKNICYFKFNPDLVLVSAGFDAAIGDPLVNWFW